MDKYTCSICNRFAATTFLPVLRHIGQVHQYEANFQVKCGLESCPRLYRSYVSYKSHVYRKHKSVMSQDDAAVTSTTEDAALALFHS